MVTQGHHDRHAAFRHKPKSIEEEALRGQQRYETYCNSGRVGRHGAVLDE